MALFDILYRGKTEMSIRKLERTYEGNMCMRHGLEIAEFIGGDPDKTYIFLVPDFLSPETKKVVE